MNRTARLVRIIVSPAPVFVILLLSASLAVAQSAVGNFDPFPLRPANTSSPRDSLRSFNTSLTQAGLEFRAREPREVVVRSLARAQETLDLSKLSARGRHNKELESALFLKEILDRIELPPEQEIPGVEEVENKEHGVDQWTIPNTSITIARVVEGPRVGEFLFTAETVGRLEEFYERAKDLPYKPGALVGLYEEVAHSPGAIVPQVLADALPAWSKRVVLGEALWQWLAFAIVVGATLFLLRGFVRLGCRWDERHRNAGALKRLGLLIGVVAGIGVLALARLIIVYAIQFLSDWYVLVSAAIWIAIFIGIAWLVVLATSRIAEAINDARQVKQGSVDGQLVRTLFRLLSIVMLVLLLFYAATFFGIPLTPVAAGLGIGGIALALAVRPTLENVIGGLTLFADKPVKIGEFCRFGSEYGVVEEIGLRSTRLRTLDDTLVSVPNADFSQRELVNYARRTQRLYRTMLGLRYETTPEQLRYLMTRLREMLLGHPKVSPELLHVRFHGFGAYSLDVEIFAYIRATEWLDYRAIREDINLRIMDIVKEAGTGFAFPSQTTYLGRDSGLDAERGQQAESEVEKWRSRGQLPFPDFDEGLQWDKQDILDYPPQGSPGYKPRKGLSDPQP